MGHEVEIKMHRSARQLTFHETSLMAFLWDSDNPKSSYFFVNKFLNSITVIDSIFTTYRATVVCMAKFAVAD